MATLSVWQFDTAEGAARAQKTLVDLSKQELITLHDAAVVSWPADKRRPKTEQAANLTGAGALGGSFWGLLFGLIFFVPLLGMAVGAAVGALNGSLRDVGIDDDFIRSVQDEVKPGTSALFVMSSDAVADKVREAFVGQHRRLLTTNLSNDQEDALRRAFSE